MDIGIIGRLGPAEASFSDLASAVGCDVFFHDRIIDGARPEALTRFIDGCSIVVIVVDVTPVALVRAASAHMTRRMRTPLLLRRAELGRFAGLMAPLAAHHARDREDEDVVESQPLLRTATGRR
jgi:hypothetical protein